MLDMADGYQDKVCNQVFSFLKRQGWDYAEKEDEKAKRFDVHYGKSSCVVKIYSTGTIQVQGPESKLKETLTQLKEAIEKNEVLAEILPFEIEASPETIQQNIPPIDPVVNRQQKWDTFGTLVKRHFRACSGSGKAVD